VRSGDGALVHQPSGERFEIQIMHRSGSGPEKEANIIADGWKSLGATVTFTALTQQQSNDAEYLGKRTGPYLTAPTGEGFSDSRLHSSGIGRPETRWTGPNRGGYNNPRVDAILDKLVVTIDPREQLTLHRQLLQEQMGDIAIMPLYWEVSPILMLKGISGPRMAYNATTFNMWEWTRQ
jgi:peptide/nickel transport system substrate-binding protein